MATLVIRVADQPAADALAHCHGELRGDVVEVVPDGWPFSAAELSDPSWRIVSLPAVSLDAARALAARGRVERDGHVPPARAFGLDLGHPSMPPALAAHLADPARAVPVFASDLTAAGLSSLRVARGPSPHPAVFGGDRRIFD